MTMKDPVCGMEIEEQKAAARAAHKGKTYYFCAAACRETFVKAPEKYIVSEKAVQKGAA